MEAYRRAIVEQVQQGLRRRPQLIHVLMGPRQVGKTTAASAIENDWDGPVRYAAADEMLPPGPEWIRLQFELARGETSKGTPLLILDEIQKISGWSDLLKSEWDLEKRT